MKIYLLIALRRLYREKLYAFISVLSLAISMAAIIVVGSYIHFELSFDKYHPDYQRIVRVLTHLPQPNGNDDSVSGGTPYNWTDVFIKDYPNIGIGVEFSAADNISFRHQDQLEFWSQVYYTDANAFEIFHHEILAGNVARAFDQPNSIAVSESFAQYYFGDEYPIDKQLQREDQTYSVSIVFKDIPENAHLRYDVLLPRSSRPPETGPTANTGQPININRIDAFSYLKLNPDFDYSSMPILSEEFVNRYGRAPNQNRWISYSLQPLSHIHLLDAHVRNISPNIKTSNLANFFGISAIGLLVIVVGCINTINLSTARASRILSLLTMQRLLGADKRALVTQSLTESLVMALIALLISIGLVEMASLFKLSDIIGGSTRILNWQTSPGFLSLLLLLCLLVALLAAFYPALHAASLSTGKHIAGGKNMKGVWARNILISLQLVLAVASIAGTLLLLNQIRYLTNKDLGFSLNNRLSIAVSGPNQAAVKDRLISELQTNPNIISISRSSWLPNGGMFFILAFTISGQVDAGEPQRSSILVTDENFFDTLGVDIASAIYPKATDSSKNTAQLNPGVYVNQAFIDNVSWDKRQGENPLGQTINVGREFPPLVISGIFKNFHSASLYRPVEPLIVITKPVQHFITEALFNRASLILHYHTDDERAFLQTLTETVERHNPGYPITINFLEDDWKSLYGDDNKIFKQICFFAGLSIALSLLGLFGLAAYNTQARQREISIRKTIGATTAEILVLMGKNVLIMAALASVPAWLLVYRLYAILIERFAYKVDLSLPVFAAAAIIVILLSQATVLTQSWRASQRNPAESLRYE